MQTARFILLLVAGAVLASGVTMLLFVLLQGPALPAGTQTIPYQFQVAQYPGIDVATDIFRLGAVSPDASAHRTLIITDALGDVMGPDGTATPKRVRIYARGEGSEWLSIAPSETAVPADVLVVVDVPEGAPFGTYRGLLYVVPVRAGETASG